MDVDGASTFLACTILMSAGLAILGIAVVFLNNLFNRYWRPVRIFTSDSWHINPPQFATEEELRRVEPTVDTPAAKK